MNQALSRAQPTERGACSLPAVNGGRVKVIVAVCTHQRNGPLRVLLEALVRVAQETSGRAELGVLVVDDNPDKRAQEVAVHFKDSFALGLHLRWSGAQNISRARNLAIGAASELGDWVAMIDDDCEPEPSWLLSFLEVIDRTGADCVTGPMHLRVPVGTAPWLSDQPFFDDLRFDLVDGQPMEVAATNNSMISAQFLRSNRGLQFLPELGQIGGEDMVFYRSAAQLGLRIRFAKHAGVWGNEPVERATLRHQVRYRFWLGNSEAVTNRIIPGTSPLRLFVRGMRRFAMAVVRPGRRILRGQRPQWRYCLASLAGATGLMLGALGVRRSHPQDL